jgi:hypothetical protein
MRHVRLAFATALAALAVTFVSADALAADFTVTPNFPNWSINGQNNPPLTLVRGHTYTFAVNAPGHPFDIKTAPVTGTGMQFNTGVTGQGATNGTLTLIAPTDPSTSQLFYQCEVHSSMTGTIALVAPSPVGPPWTVALLAVALAGLAFAGVRRASAQA